MPALGPVLPCSFGRYTLVERVGAGGMATVYRALLGGEGGFEKEVAVKVVREELANDPQFRTLFLDEARLSARLAHANLVQTFDFGQVEGTWFLAMEFVRGRTLANLLRALRTRDLWPGTARSLHLAAEVATGLGHAHRLAAPDGTPLGLVHRDVSPQNVLVSAEGEVKLGDFGIAKAALSSHVTQPGKVRGKCAYMAPEQARGRAVDARADVFSLGVMLWECLTGTALFDGGSDAEILLQVLQKQVAPPSRLRADVPPEVDAAVLRMLAKDPAARPANGDEVARELGALKFRLARSPTDLDLRELERALRSGTAVQLPAAPRSVEVPIELTAPVGQGTEPPDLPGPRSIGEVGPGTAPADGAPTAPAAGHRSAGAAPEPGAAFTESASSGASRTPVVGRFDVAEPSGPEGPAAATTSPADPSRAVTIPASTGAVTTPAGRRGDTVGADGARSRSSPAAAAGARSGRWRAIGLVVVSVAIGTALGLVALGGFPLRPPAAQADPAPDAAPAAAAAEASPPVAPAPAVEAKEPPLPARSAAPDPAATAAPLTPPHGAALATPAPQPDLEAATPAAGARAVPRHGTRSSPQRSAAPVAAPATAGSAALAPVTASAPTMPGGAAPVPVTAAAPRMAGSGAPGPATTGAPPATVEVAGRPAAPAPSAARAQPAPAELVVSSLLAAEGLQVRIDDGPARALPARRPISLEVLPGRRRIAIGPASRACVVTVELAEGKSLALHQGQDGAVLRLDGTRKHVLACE